MLKLGDVRAWFRPKAEFPDVVPDERTLHCWARSEWLEYQAWLFHHGFVSRHAWEKLRRLALHRGREHSPLISLITPVYNTPAGQLEECLYSVQTQTYPYWELCLADDGSTRPETLALLTEYCSVDGRFRLHRLEQNQGICTATNSALAMARGDYIAFLDHDDRLAPDALHHVAETLCAAPDTDILYSDRDMLSPRNRRFMHLFKPGWSPETLLAGNYLFHLLVYRRSLIQNLGGIRASYEGSQDYDLILRAADNNPKVAHVPKVLYHWRQHDGSVSMQHNAKAYAYDAGIKALQDTLQRRGISGEVSENTELWRGNYRVRLQRPPAKNYSLLRIENPQNYRAEVNRALYCADTDYLVILGPDVEAIDTDSIAELVSWLQIPGVALVTGKLIDTAGSLLHAGLVQRADGSLVSLYAGHPESTAGYMAVTANTRNVSQPHPACCALRRQDLIQTGGLDEAYQGLYALAEYAFTCRIKGLRTVYAPFSRFRASTLWHKTDWDEAERETFVRRHQVLLCQGDPFYNPWLTLEKEDMGLDMRACLG